MNQDAFTLIIEDNSLLMQYITKWLIELGMKSDLKGFTYLKEAIYLYSDIIYTNKRFNYIYSVIAAKYCVSAKNVERSIHTSIEAVWYSNTLNRSHKLFECAYINADYPPTNTVFIAAMSESIKLTFNKQKYHCL